MITRHPLAAALGVLIVLCALACTRADRDVDRNGAEPGSPLDLPADTARSAEESDLELELRKTGLGWEATLTNHGATRMLVLAPGDGSDYGWRTPRLDWQIEPLDGAEFMLGGRARCGNMNPLQPEELLVIEPGASASFDAFLNPPWVDLEQYHVSVRYTNDPAIVWKGGELGPHHPSAFEAVKRSTACTVQSNRVLVDRR